jgi:hypothetical protein
VLQRVAAVARGQAAPTLPVAGVVRAL